MDTLFVTDVAVIICLMVLANLSRRIGEALRIQKIYTTFYFTSAMVVVASFVDAVFNPTIPYLTDVTLIVRVVAVLISIPVAVKYWHWLFNEKLQK